MSMAVREKKRIRSSYNQLGGELYNLRYRGEQEVKYEIIDSMTPLRIEDTVLDDGCGSGMFMDRFVGTMVGFDLSGELLEAARRNVNPLHHLVQGDAENLPFRDGVFDATVSVTLIQNTPDPELAVSEMRRVTRIGAKVTVTGLKKLFTLERFREILDSAGFSDVSLLSSETEPDWFAACRR